MKTFSLIFIYVWKICGKLAKLPKYNPEGCRESDHKLNGFIPWLYKIATQTAKNMYIKQILNFEHTEN